MVNAILVLLTGLGWGLLGPASKALFAADPGVFDGLTVSLARGLWAFPFFAIGLGAVWRLEKPRLSPRRWAIAIAAGLLFGLVISVVFTIASQHTSVAHLSFFVGFTPVTNTVAAALVFREPLGRRSQLALALGVLGVVLLAFTKSSSAATLLGDGLMLVWLVAFAAYACLLRAVGPSVSSAFVMAFVGTISMGALIVPALFFRGIEAAAHAADAPQIAWWFFGEVVFGSTLVAQTAYAAAVRRMGVSAATIGAEYIALAVGVLASVAMHERWTPLTVVSGLMFCAALAVSFVPRPRLGRRGDSVEFG